MVGDGQTGTGTHRITHITDVKRDVFKETRYLRCRTTRTLPAPPAPLLMSFSAGLMTRAVRKEEINLDKGLEIGSMFGDN